MFLTPVSRVEQGARSIATFRPCALASVVQEDRSAGSLGGIRAVTYHLLKFGQILGAILMGAGLIGVCIADLRSRQLRDLGRFSEAVRSIAVSYDGLVVPGALLLAVSGIWMIAELYGGFAFLGVP